MNELDNELQKKIHKALKDVAESIVTLKEDILRRLSAAEHTLAVLESKMKELENKRD